MSSSERRHFSVMFKLKVIKHFEESGSITATAKAFNVDRKSVRSWSKDKESLNSISNRRVRCGRTTAISKCKWPILEEKLTRWIEDRRKTGACLSSKSIIAKAHQLQIEDNSLERDFRGSTGWFRRFIKRNNFSLRRISTSGRNLPENCVQIINQFLSSCSPRILGPKSGIFNMDETSIYLDSPSKQSQLV